MGGDSIRPTGGPRLDQGFTIQVKPPLAYDRAPTEYERMRKLILTAMISLIAASAHAVSRYEITNVTCETVQALIRTEGSVILVYRSSGILGLPIYDRYVAGQQYCDVGEVVRGAGVPTVDREYCPVRKCVASDIFRAR
jgi:hypothetical protein